MPYVTAGLAWGKTSGDLAVAYKPNGVDTFGTSFASVEETHVGYAVGGGLEWMLAHNWTVKAEYLFIDLGEEDYAYVGKTKGGLTYDTDHHHADLELHTVRVGVNYKFDN